MKFLHSGDLGDLIYALPAMRGLGGGELVLCPADCTREPLTRSRAEVVIALLERQPYLTNVRWAPGREHVDVDFNGFRAKFNDPAIRRMAPLHKNIAQYVLDMVRLPYSHLNRPWLTIPPLVVDAPDVLICRSARYQNPAFPWRAMVARCSHLKIGFIGTPREYQQFCDEYGELEYQSTETLLRAAALMAQSAVVIANQSAPLAVAQGMFKQGLLVEVYPQSPDCIYYRDGAWYIHGGGSVELAKMGDILASLNVIP